MNGTHHPSWGILLSVCEREPTKRAPWRIWRISSDYACNCLKICSDVVVSFVIQKNHKTKDNLIPHSVTSLLHTSQNSRTSYGIAYKMRDFSAKALVHSIYLLTFFFTKCPQSSIKFWETVLLLHLSPFLLLSPLHLPISPLPPSHFLSLCLSFCLHHRPVLPSKRSRATFTLVSSINSWEFQ